MTAISELGTPHFGCSITTTFKFPDLNIYPQKTGSLFASKGCKISETIFNKPIHYIPEKQNEFFTFVDSRDAIAHSSVVWENDDCPPEDMTILGKGLNWPFAYFDYCGNYTITANSVYPAPQGNCSVKSDEYPIPNWNITKTDTGCNIGKVAFLEFYIYVDSWTAMATATVSWEDAQCQTQTKWIKGSLPNYPFMYYDTCGQYTIRATSKGANCVYQTDEYPIPNLRIFNFPSGVCLIQKI